MYLSKLPNSSLILMKARALLTEAAILARLRISPGSASSRAIFFSPYPATLAKSKPS